MIIHCPKCQARLNLPDDSAGSEVRCSTCRQVFRADPNQLSLPDEVKKRTPSNGPEIPQLHLDPYEPRRTRREDEEDRDLRGPRQDRTVLEENAREHTQLAGLVMMTAFYGTIGALVVNRLLAAVLDFEEAGNNVPVIANLEWIGIFLRVVVFAPLLMVVYSAGRNLLGLGPRGMINAGVGVNFVLVALFAIGILSDFFSMALPIRISPATVVPQMVVGGLAGSVNLAAAILALRALAQPHVQEFYQRQYQRPARYRY